MRVISFSNVYACAVWWRAAVVTHYTQVVFGRAEGKGEPRRQPNDRDRHVILPPSSRDGHGHCPTAPPLLYYTQVSVRRPLDSRERASTDVFDRWINVVPRTVCSTTTTASPARHNNNMTFKPFRGSTAWSGRTALLTIVRRETPPSFV